ncbi:MAG: hypothetical protein ACFCVD_16080 [Nodosilinea sp.]
MISKSVSRGRWLSLVMAGLLMVTTLFMGGPAQALQLDEMLTSAGNDYLSSILEDYTEASKDSYGNALKLAQKTVNSLAGQLEKAADPGTKTSERAAILKDVNKSQKSLQDLATTFSDQAAKAKVFDHQLQAAVEDLLKLVKGDVSTQLGQNEAALKQISSVVTSLATSAGQIDENNLTDVLTSFGTNINDLNQALDLGTKALEAAAAFTQ